MEAAALEFTISVEALDVTLKAHDPLLTTHWYLLVLIESKAPVMFRVAVVAPP
jgi:hypothetical protein